MRAGRDGERGEGGGVDNSGKYMIVCIGCITKGWTGLLDWTTRLIKNVVFFC